MPKDAKAKDEEGILLLTWEIIAHRDHPKHRGGQNLEHALRPPVTPGRRVKYNNGERAGLGVQES